MLTFDSSCLSIILFLFVCIDHDVLLEKKGYSESDWAVIIVQHLMSRLTVDSNYVIDSSYSNKLLEKCPCKDHDDLVTNPGDLSYGTYRL